jgi:peptidoglycan/xylan/chitin deacetylase (PgdA/CDA1 family)
VDALVLTYHAVERGDGPLFVDPGTFEAHLDAIVASGATVTTVTELARAIRAAEPSGRHVSITFDDGLASVARIAAPLLAERGLRATVFCVAAHVGRDSNWPSALPDAPPLELADRAELTLLLAQGWEIGSHGMTHAPIQSEDDGFLSRELVESRALLEEQTGGTVTSFAYPYGASPGPAGARVVATTYEAACTTALDGVTAGCDRYALPRVDAHYVRRPRLFRAALAGSLGPYLRVRRLGVTARRTLMRDYVQASR